MRVVSVFLRYSTRAADLRECCSLALLSRISHSIFGSQILCKREPCIQRTWYACVCWGGVGGRGGFFHTFIKKRIPKSYNILRTRALPLKPVVADVKLPGPCRTWYSFRKLELRFSHLKLRIPEEITPRKNLKQKKDVDEAEEKVVRGELRANLSNVPSLQSSVLKEKVRGR